METIILIVLVLLGIWLFLNILPFFLAGIIAICVILSGVIAVTCVVIYEIFSWLCQPIINWGTRRKQEKRRRRWEEDTIRQIQKRERDS